VVARALHPSCLTIDASAMLPQSGTQKDVVETQTAIAFPALPLVIPEGVHWLFGMERANGIGPALREKALIRGAALGL
jgi:hypothetical protein